MSPQAVCAAVQTVPSTQRQFWFCDLPAGHARDHKAIAPNGQVVHRWPAARVAASTSNP